LTVGPTRGREATAPQPVEFGLIQVGIWKSRARMVEVSTCHQQSGARHKLG